MMTEFDKELYHITDIENGSYNINKLDQHFFGTTLASLINF